MAPVAAHVHAREGRFDDDAVAFAMLRFDMCERRIYMAAAVMMKVALVAVTMAVRANMDLDDGRLAAVKRRGGSGRRGVGGPGRKACRQEGATGNEGQSQTILHQHQ